MRENIILSVDFEGADLTTKKTLTLSKTIHDLGQEKKRLAKEIKNLDTSSKTYDKDLSSLIAKQNQVNAKLKVSKKEYADNERAVINNTKSTRALDGSLEQMRGELNALTSSYDRLSKEQRENSKVGGAQLKRIKELDEELKTLEESTGRHQRSVGNYSKSLNGLKIESEELKKVKSKLKAEIKENSLAVSSAEKKINELKNEINTLDKSSKDYDSTLNKLQQEIKETNSKSESYKQNLNSLKNALKDNNESIKKNGVEIRRARTSIDGISNTFKGLGTAIRTATGAFLAIQGIIQTFSFFRDFANEIGDSNKMIRDFTGLSNEASKSLSNLSLAISQTFGVEQEQVLVSANALSQQMGISFEEALEKINLGFSAGLNNNGEFLDQLKEYPTLLNEVGLTADETFNLINQTVKSGVYSDKGIDAIKEAGLSIREMTQPTKDAINAIGLSSDQIERSLSDGSKSVIDVIKQISTQMATLPPQSKEVGTVIADVFKGAGEDAGLDFLLTLKDINSEFSEQTLNLNEQQQAQLDLAKANEQLNTVFNKYFGDSSTGFKVLKATAISFFADGLQRIIKGAVDLTNRFIGLYNESLPLRAVFNSIGSILKNSFQASILPIKTLINAFGTLGNVVSKIFTGDFADIPNLVKEGLKDIGTDFTDLGKNVYDDFANGIKNAKEQRISPIEFTPDEVSSAEKQAEKIGLAVGTTKVKSEIKAITKANKEKIKLEKEAQKELEKQIVKDTKNLQEYIFKIENENLINSIDNKFDAEKKKLEIEKTARQKDIENSLADERTKKEALMLLDEEFRNKEKELEAEREKEETEKEKEKLKQKRELAINSAQIISDELMSNQRRRIDQETKREIEALNLQKQAGEISEEEFAKKREEIDRKAFRRKKRLDTSQAIINGLVGASKIIAQTGVFSPIPLATLAVQTASQVAGIQAQTFAKGGYTGKSSESADHTGQKPVGIVHENEFVANRHALRTPLGSEMANKLNQINKNPSLGYYADGGFSSTNNQVSTEGIELTISKALTDMKVINVATETSNVDNRVKKIQNKGRI